MLQNKEVELSSAVITFGTIPAYREDNDGVWHGPANDARRKEACEDELHSSCLDGAVEVFPLEDTAQGCSRCAGNPSWLQRICSLPCNNAQAGRCNAGQPIHSS